MKVLQVLLSFIFILQWAKGEHFTVVGQSRFFNNKAIRNVLANMNLHVDPCTDYYEYVCGRWTEQHASVPYNAATCMMEFEANLELSNAVELMNSRNKTGFEINVMDYYSSCTTARETYALKNFITAFENLEDSGWFDADSDWAGLLGVMRSYGMNNFFVTEEMFYKNENVMYITLKRPEPKGEEYTLTDEDISMLKANLPKGYVTNMFWQTLKEFDEEQEKLYSLPGVVNNKVIKLKNLPVPWLKTYLENMLNVTALDPNFEVIIVDLEYFSQLQTLLNEYEDSFIYKYLQLQFLSYLDDTLIGDMSNIPCMQLTNENLALATSWIYEQQHPEVVDEFPKVYKIFENIHAQVVETLQEDDSDVITEEVMETLKDIKFKIGILPRINTLEVLEDLHSDLTTDETNFYENHLKILGFNFKKSHTVNKITLNKNIDQYFAIAPKIGECHDVLPHIVENLLVLPVTLLRQPYFHWAYSDFSIYSTLGTRIASGILAALSLELGEEEYEIIEMAAIHITLEAFFSNIPEEYKDGEIFEVMKRVFLVQASQYFCDDDDDGKLPQIINKFVHESPKFSEAFGCKNDDNINIFA